jgi:ring-1,2-phenylacetyl-CoA epoxidase subunit PaaD
MNTPAASHSSTQAEVWAALDPLTDPEIPVITLREMGILREVRHKAGTV